MSVPSPNHWIVTANFTESGSVAWRKADGTWSLQIADAGLLADEAAATAVATAASTNEQRVVSDPYAIGVLAEGGAIDPLTARERIRAAGPSIPMRRPDAGLRR